MNLHDDAENTVCLAVAEIDMSIKSNTDDFITMKKLKKIALIVIACQNCINIPW